MLQTTNPCATAPCPAPSGPPVVATVLAVLRPLALLVVRIVGHLRQQARRRATCRALAALSDHAMRDIGIERAHICAAVLGQERECARLRAQAPSGGIESL